MINEIYECYYCKKRIPADCFIEDSAQDRIWYYSYTYLDREVHICPSCSDKGREPYYDECDIVTDDRDMYDEVKE